MDPKTKVERFPTRPGVYLMKDSQGHVLYVGKAKNLRARVRSYFRAEADGRPNVRLLMERTADIEWVVTDSDQEAYILENSLIKKHRPRYNVALRDDKSYLSLKITLDEPFPRLIATRRIKRDGGLYFGPYSSGRDVHATVDLLHRLFPLRHCSEAEFRRRTRPCIYCQTRGCKAPCCGFISETDYRKMVDEVIRFLKGRKTDLLDRLKAEMKTASAREDFEEAARLRDRVRALEAILEKQKAVTHAPMDRDAVAWVREGAEAQVAVLVVRSGSLLDRRGYYLNGLLGEDAETMAEFLRRYYREGRIVPAEVLVDVDLGEEAGALEDWLSEARGRRVRVTLPERGEKAALLRMARENAAELLAERRKSKVGYEAALEELRARLHLPAPPRRIECYDVSNTQGREAVASMVTFLDGFPAKDGYRRFAIRTVEGADDFAMLHETLTRRFARSGPGWERPDLVVVDGGRGQLSAARKAMEESDAADVPAVGLAKSRLIPGTGDEAVHSPERVFLPGRVNPVIPPRNSSALFLLQRIRDEAHRFAVTYHRTKGRKKAFASELDGIAGLGPARKKALMARFGSVKAVREAAVEEIAAVPGISWSLAERISEKLGKR